MATSSHSELARQELAGMMLSSILTAKRHRSEDRWEKAVNDVSAAL